MNYLRIFIHVVLIIFLSIPSFGQKEKKYIRQGTREFNEQQYGNAEVTYQKAATIKPESFEARFNLGNALYKQEKYDKAIEKFTELTNGLTDKEKLSSLYHNMGNCYLNKTSKLLKEQKLDESIKEINKSIDSYKNALKNNPNDRETKYNLQYSNKLKQLLEDQKNKQQNNQDKNKQNQDDQNGENGDQNNQDQNKDQNKPNKDDSDGDGIPDKTEKGENADKPRDTDKDGTPDYKDTDSDNDGKSDSEEAGENPTQPKDSDKDGLPDYRDLDSDNDGKPDSEEPSENDAKESKNKNQLSKEDALRLLNAIENDEKNVQDKLKKVKGKKIKKTDKDW